MAYVPVPKDLSKVKTKVAFNLTKRQIVCFAAALLFGLPLFFLLNSYTTGLSPSVMAYILRDVLGTRFGGNVTADEIGLPVEATGGVLPCGSTAIWQK